MSCESPTSTWWKTHEPSATRTCRNKRKPKESRNDPAIRDSLVRGGFCVGADKNAFPTALVHHRPPLVQRLEVPSASSGKDSGARAGHAIQRHAGVPVGGSRASINQRIYDDSHRQFVRSSGQARTVR